MTTYAEQYAELSVNAVLMECQACGSAVSDTLKHDASHQELRDVIAALWGALPGPVQGFDWRYLSDRP